MTFKLPALPDDDSDFTPELARKLIAKYQEFLADVLADNDRLHDMCINREEFIANHNLWREFSQYLSEPKEVKNDNQ